MSHVLPCIQQDVAKHVPHLSRRAEHPEVIPFSQHRPAPAEDPLHHTCEPRPEGLHPAAQGPSIRGLDDEMRVIRLQGDVNKAEVGPLPAVPQRRLERPNEARRAERGDARAQAEGHVCRVRSGEVDPAFHAAPAASIAACDRRPDENRPNHDEQ